MYSPSKVTLVQATLSSISKGEQRKRWKRKPTQNTSDIPLEGPGKRIMVVEDVVMEDNTCSIIEAATSAQQRRREQWVVFVGTCEGWGILAYNIRYHLSLSGNFVVDCSGFNGGLMLLWSDRWKVEIKSFSVGHIDAVIEDQEFRRWQFTGFYGQPKAVNRHHMWNLIRRLKPLSNLPWLCGGDFNETLLLEERCGGAFRNQAYSRAFQQILIDCNLDNIPFKGFPFTWNNKRKRAVNIQAHLDRFLASDDWLNLFSESWSEHLPFFSSDHKPILIHSEERQAHAPVSKNCQVRFEPFWLKEHGYFDVVRESWSRGPSSPFRRQKNFKFSSSLSDCRKRLQKWSKKSFSGWKQILEKKEKRLQQLYESPDSLNLMAMIKELESEIQRLQCREKGFRKQRARIDWLNKGDCNTRFFHSRAKARFSANRIDKLKNEQGEWTRSEQYIGELVSTFF
ncbi:Unknown protein [Striga hermonthica]|uniref:Endonuclease/exonuclease/phosphatase domain-containing protein n=1 Tax=Striga hermonthica TaxID=68872 RepID=A0A9N7MHW9_STRHE|nr:Unknown protein [Striga hermonthica]